MLGRCDQCLFYIPMRKGDENLEQRVKTEDIGHCMKAIPHVFMIPKPIPSQVGGPPTVVPMFFSTRPTTRPHEFCGDFKPKLDS